MSPSLNPAKASDAPAIDAGPRPSPLRRLAGKVARRLRKTLSRAAYRHAGGENRPVFFDVEETLPELRAIDRNYAKIRSELGSILPRLDTIPRYHEVDGSQERISNSDDLSWRVFFVYLWRQEDNLGNAQQFPETVKILKEIPCVLNAFFSILDPGKSVPAHEGPSYHYLRYHTGFLVPKNNPPTIRVKDRYHTWKEGESLLFDDSWDHEVINNSDDIRVVLIVDLMRPVSLRIRLLDQLVRRLTTYSLDDDMRDGLFEKMGFQESEASTDPTA